MRRTYNHLARNEVKYSLLISYIHIDTDSIITVEKDNIDNMSKVNDLIRDITSNINEKNQIDIKINKY